MKIAYVVDDTLDKPDGVQQYVLSIGEWMRSRGHDVHYIVGHSVRADVANVHSLAQNIRVKFNGNTLTIPWRASMGGVRRLLCEQQFDVLHVQMPYSPLFAHRVLRAAEDTTARVGTFHIMPNNWVASWGTKLLRVPLHSSLARLDAVFAVSPVAKTFADWAFGVHATVLPNAINTRPFLRARQLPEHADATTIVYLNRLVPRKGPQYLLRAVRMLVEDQGFDQQFRVLICGKGEMAVSLQRYIDAHNMGSYVQLMGFVPENAKARYLASADVAVYPSTGGESFGIVLIEGLAACRGVVLAGNNPGYASVMAGLEDQLFDPSDTEGFARLLGMYLRNPRKRAASVKAQRELAKHFDTSVVGEQLEQAYEQALRARRDVQ